MKPFYTVFLWYISTSIAFSQKAELKSINQLAQIDILKTRISLIEKSLVAVSIVWPSSVILPSRRSGRYKDDTVLSLYQFPYTLLEK